MKLNVKRNVVLSVGEVLINTAVMFVLFRFLLEEVGVDGVGIWSLVLTTTSLAKVADVGVGRGLLRFAALTDESKGVDQATYVETGALTVAAFYGIICAAAYLPLRETLRWLIPSEQSAVAIAILPYAVVSFWCANVANVSLSAMGGAHRMDLKSKIQSLSFLLKLGVALGFVPQYGLIAMGWAQLAQTSFALIVSWFFAQRIISGLAPIPTRFRMVAFKQMVSYGFKLQVTSIAALFFEPTTRMILARTGGLEATGLYEMASRLVVQGRRFVIAAYQAFIPVFAHLDESGSKSLKTVYAGATTVMWIGAPLAMGGLGAALPLISWIWIGRVDHVFLTFAAILVVGWCINMLCMPAYFRALGVGILRWNVIGHLVMAGLNLAAGLLLGTLVGPYGVAAGAMTALIVSSALILWGNHHIYRTRLTELLPRRAVLAVVASIAAAALSACTYWLSVSIVGNEFGALAAAGLGTVIIALGAYRAGPSLLRAKREALLEHGA